MHGTTALVFFCDGAGREAVVRGGGFRSTFSWRDGKRGISPSSVGVLLIIYKFIFFYHASFAWSDGKTLRCSLGGAVKIL